MLCMHAATRVVAWVGLRWTVAGRTESVDEANALGKCGSEFWGFAVYREQDGNHTKKSSSRSKLSDSLGLRSLVQRPGAERLGPAHGRDAYEPI
jgi:hypothetical protein